MKFLFVSAGAKKRRSVSEIRRLPSGSERKRWHKAMLKVCVPDDTLFGDSHSLHGGLLLCAEGDSARERALMPDLLLPSGYG